MSHKLIPLLAFGALALAGCKTLHTNDGERSRAVAAWPDVLVVEKDGRRVPAPADLVVDSLKKVGITATADDEGLHIVPEDQERAEEALLTDERLAKSGILVFIPVGAGTGRRTADGIEFKIPTTQSGK